ncbi:MAG: tRNA (N(6)-L-threonylcarbamoyladenosine(37)-C(2))-methylthiotransferase MtaB, partial [Deltaproteobacteria bacterium]|nr:tRNA (N(6)-L-threonylcarbamoyladenosine(37)-C(2))-methylthiotransferase MtaB [Deltaproteobacteria bacterium]
MTAAEVSEEKAVPRRAAVTTLGCRTNQYDSSAIEDFLREAGFTTVPFSESADVYVINTCTVTSRTDYQSRQLIRRAKRKSPDSIVIATGCYAQTSPDEVSNLNGVDYVLGNPEKAMVVECIRKGRPAYGPVIIVGAPERGTPLSLRARGPYSRTRVNLKVQDGCNKACSYCIIPRARGTSKSVPLNSVIKEAEGFIEKGFKEIVVTGIHLGAYGRDLVPAITIVDLLREIEKRNYPCRFRLSSLDPDEVTDELIGVLKGSRTVCNHLHLALQSGDDRVLKGMKRPYTSGYFAGRAVKLSEEVPGISIGADVIAGFPGEGEREFENTLNLIKELPLAYLHVFPYSRREGTAACAYPGQLNRGVKKGRAKMLMEIDREKREGFYRVFL